jgi:hypothetical protein
VDFSRLNRTRVLVGGAASILLVLSLIFLPWFELDSNPQREGGPASNPDFNQDAFICGTGEFECTGFETFPIMRWLLILAALAPLILAYILVRGHKLSWAPGELTMVAGFTAFVLIAYNGIIDRPGATVAETGNSLDLGYWLALLAALVIAATGFIRSLESGGRKARKAPGTV